MSGNRRNSVDASALNSLDCWDYSIELECLQGPEDLQLAAELGKTLLERNKELENSLKQHQNVIEDQTQEIEYLTKQTAALREVNDSRLRIYEQLEVSIQDLERANQRLALDNSADKKYIKSLCVNIDSLEARCEELQRHLDEVTLQQDSYRRRQQRATSVSSPGGAPATALPNALSTEDTQTADKQTAGNVAHDEKELSDDEEMITLLTQLQELRSQRGKEQRRVSELEEQLTSMLKENLLLEEQLAILRQKEADMKSMQEEISTLEEIRQGHLCGRCLRNVDTRGHDEISLLMDHEEEDDVSVVNSLVSETHRTTVILQIEDPNSQPHYDNPYRVLVEKYEALVQMQRPDNKRHSQTANSLSLQEELQITGDFSAFNSKEMENDNEEADAVVPNQDRINSKPVKRSRAPAEKTISMTPTDFSEAETSSSGFSDETSNKNTQTDDNLPPGYFLCSIADGTDCRFSIYDDANPVESRFRKKPKYRQLFREIFDVLKRAAENKDEGEQLPLLDDVTPVTDEPKVPPVTPAREDLPDNFPSKKTNAESLAPEDTKSIAEELASITNTKSCSNEPSTHDGQVASHTKPEQITEKATIAEPPKKSPPKRDLLEYLSIGVGIRKKSSNKKNSPSKAPKMSVAERVERIESPLAVGVGVSSPTRVGNSGPRKRRELRFAERMSDSAPTSRPESPRTSGAWYNREPAHMTPPTQQQSVWDYKPFLSSASQEVAKLKRLEKSYAEVLRLGPQPSHRPMSINGYRRH